MNGPVDLQSIRCRKALDDWLVDCRMRMGARFPKVDFDSDNWPIRRLHKTEQPDLYFAKYLADFVAKDIDYCDALRCLVAEIVLAGKPKDLHGTIRSFRRLKLVAPKRLCDLALQDLRRLESDWLCDARDNPSSANAINTDISHLESHLALLAAKAVLPRFGFHKRAEVKAELRKIQVLHQANRRAGKAEILDRKMEAFNDAFNAMVDNRLGRDGKPVLSALDREAICASILLLCAPSRINEPLCMSIDDHVIVEEYAEKPVGDLDAIHRAHQMLIVTMKGSKGAEWSPKPVLDFMIDAFRYATNIIKEQGKRSRMLVQWYQKNSATLFLPAELEYLRGQSITRRALTKIINLTESLPDGTQNQAACVLFNELKACQFKGPDPEFVPKKGRAENRKMVDLLPWADVEALLLRKIHEAMDRCRRVTQSNHYEGELAKMLFLFDRGKTPYQPSAVTNEMLARRLKHSEFLRRQSVSPTLFEKLHITIPVGGKNVIAEMDSHDPRRWLTTMALIHGEMLSDALINKWANRCKLSQLKAYDLRTAETMAAQSAMPAAAKLTELADMSNGLAAIEKLEDRFGLVTAIVTAHDAGIAMTSMDEISRAVENRPVAKSSRGIIIIYPQRFGVCFHQHHEKPCRNFSNDLEASCVTCNEGAFTKGHIPTNDETRRIAKLLFGSVIRHLENLAHTHNRCIADDPAALGEHMLALIEKGLDKATLEQYAIHLIEEVHQINHLLKDRLLARRLEQAFVAGEVVKLLDDSGIKNGALIKYHNPTRHSEPLLELALDAHGGRKQVVNDELVLISMYSQFAPKALCLTDERHLIEPDDNEEDD